MTEGNLASPGFACVLWGSGIVTGALAHSVVGYTLSGVAGLAVLAIGAYYVWRADNAE